MQSGYYEISAQTKLLDNVRRQIGNLFQIINKYSPSYNLWIITEK